MHSTSKSLNVHLNEKDSHSSHYRHKTGTKTNLPSALSPGHHSEEHRPAQRPVRRRTSAIPIRGHTYPRGICTLKTQYQETNEMKNFTFTAILLVWLVLGVILAFIGIVSPIVALLPILLPIGFIFALMLITEWSTLFTMILQKRSEKKKED